jgi:hypothetical protein
MDADVDEVHADGQAEISRQTLQIAANKVIGIKEKKEKKRERILGDSWIGLVGLVSASWSSGRI